mgnify:FL=1
MELKDWLSIIIPASVTIIGLITNYYATKSNIKNELEKRKGSIRLERLLQCLEEYQESYRAIMSSSKLPKDRQQEVFDKQALVFQKVMDLVYLYESEEACKITSSWQQYNYLESNTSTNKMIPVCYANLLSAQVCLDVTGNCNKPSYYYKMRLTDYNANNDLIAETHNKIVGNLKLDKRLLF